MSSKDLPKINFVLVCDDIREEKNTNKVMLWGLYTQKMFLPSVPAMLPKLAMRLSLDMSKPIVEDIEVLVRRPDKAILGGMKGIKIEVPPEAGGEGNLNLVFSPFPVELAGEYEVVLEHNKKQVSKVAFEVVIRPAVTANCPPNK